jgi:hypothetical protein
MVGSLLLRGLSWAGRLTIVPTADAVSRLPPVREVRARWRRRRMRAFADVDWFDDIGPDELAG